MQSDWFSNIWMAPEGDSNRAQQVTTGKYDGMAGVARASGGKIVYGTRDWDIWVMDEDGSHQRLLTVNEHNNRYPAVSPDGRTVFFESWRGGDNNIWRMGIDGSDLKRLTSGIGDTWPCCSPDGKWVFYQYLSAGRYVTGKISPDGGTPVLWSDKLSQKPAVSPDGKLVAGYYWDAAAARDTLNVISIYGGEPIKTFTMPPGDYGYITLRWTPDGQALTYTGQGAVTNIWIQPLSGGPAKKLTNFTSDVIWDFDWTPDKRLILARGPVNQDVVLIDNRQSP
jgi:Tol biopolymer transport system component